MTPETPCRPEPIFRYAFGEPTEDERAATEEHVANCDGCRSDLAAMQRVAAGADWRDESKSAELPSSELIARQREVAEMGEEARLAAKAFLARLLRLSPLARYVEINRDREQLTPALAWCLIDEAMGLVFSEPRTALPIIDLATYVADYVSGHGAVHSHELRVEAWKDYAWTLSFLGEYARAEAALDWAEDAASQCADRRHMLAIVHLARGIMLAQMERWSEALPLVNAARAVFAQLGDVDRATKAQEQEANIRMRIGDAEGAVAILSSIVYLPADPLTQARRFQNIAHALEMSGALWRASDFVARSRAIHSRLGVTFMLCKDTWSLARILAKTSRLDESFEQFEAARNGFLELDAVDYVIRVDLDRSEIEIDHDVATDATYARLRFAAQYAIEKTLPVAKCRALDALQQLGRAATASSVRRVRDFIDHFETNPHAVFHAADLFS